MSPTNNADDSWATLEMPDAKSSGCEEMGESISFCLLDKYSSQFEANASFKLARNVICRNEMTAALVNRDLPLDTYHVFSERLEMEAKVTNQKVSGRCWIFAALNTLRLEVMKKYSLEDFELSQSYLFWCDKLEKANWFLENILKTLDEELSGRLLQFLLVDPVQDGGQWDMAVNLIEKYGIVPKNVFPESAHSGNSRQLNWLITVKLREFARRLREMHKNGKSMEELRNEKSIMLAAIYNILVITLGAPPKSFDWTFSNKDKKFCSFKDLTPLTFLKEHVGVDLRKFVSLVHDPRNEYGRLYTVRSLGNVAEGRPVLYVNLPVEELKKYAIKTIQAGREVWFGCDVSKFCHRQSGILDLDIFDYAGAYGVDFELDKADRLRYGESAMTHAMAFSGVHLEEDHPLRWRIENSWGEDGGDKGYFCMTDAWFTEYVYQVVVDRDFLSEEQRKILEQTPIVLQPWDPLGALAK